MKIMQPSLPLQREEIEKLIDKLYRDVFPSYFTLEEMDRFKRNSILVLPGSDTHIGTLKGAFQVMACLQSIILILEGSSLTCDKATELFNKNSRILNELGVFFPFHYEHFIGEDRSIELPDEQSKAANTYLI